MGKIVQFKNKPSPSTYGQYYYENDELLEYPIEESDSVKKPYDKFSTQTLETTVVSDETRDFIIDNKLKYLGVSNIQIDKLVIRNAGVNHKVKNTHFRGFIFDKNTFDCFRSNGSLKSFSEIDTALYTAVRDSVTIDFGFGFSRTYPNDSALKNSAMFFDWNAPRYNKGRGPNEIESLTEQVIIEDFGSNGYPNLFTNVPEVKYTGTLEQGMANFNTGSWSQSGVNTFDKQPFHPQDGVGTAGAIEERLTSIFSEDGQNNYIQFVIWTRGDARRRVGTKRRRKRLYVFKVNLNEIFDLDSQGRVVGGKETKINFTEFKNVSGGGGSTPAFVVSEFGVTFNTAAGAKFEDFVPSIIAENDTDNIDILESIIPSNPINTDSFDNDFSDVNIFREPRYWTNANQGSNLFGFDFTPTSIVTIKDKNDKNLQGYKLDDINRQICSAPSTIELKLNISEKIEDELEAILEKAFPHNGNIPPYYKYCVVDWNDKDNKIRTVKDALNLKPSDDISIIKAQQKNTFIFQDTDNTLSNSYSTPGIKQVKVLLFNYIDKDRTYSATYDDLPSDKDFKFIEPIRFKLMTIRFFLDIPVNQFPDFGEVGGSDYTTIPYPFTTVVINGVDEKSNYYKSIKNILETGKIGNVDVIDETFLVQANNNDELGKTIEKMDLEQCRYFNKPHSINDLLGVNVSVDGVDFKPYNFLNEDEIYWDGETNKYSEETSVGQIFIDDNLDLDLKQSCKLELNTGELTGKSIYDSSGNSNKGLIIGDYNIKKVRQGEPMRRDSFIKVPKKTTNRKGAL